MFRTLAILCLVAPALVHSEGLSVFMTCISSGSEELVALPSTKTVASSDGWEETSQPDGSVGVDSLTMMCLSSDHAVCALYDTDGDIAGVQMSVDKDRIVGTLYDWATQGFVDWQVTVDEATENYWAKQILVAEGKFSIPGFYGTLVSIPTTASDLVSEGYTKQGYLAGRGTFYFNNLTTSTECKSDTLFPAAVLVDENEEVMGIIDFISGTYTSQSDEETSAIQTQNRSVIEKIVTDGPECAHTTADDPGILAVTVIRTTI